MALGKPIEINEETCKERFGLGGDLMDQLTDPQKSLTQLIDQKTIFVSLNLNVTFELIQIKKHQHQN